MMVADAMAWVRLWVWVCVWWCAALADGGGAALPFRSASTYGAESTLLVKETGRDRRDVGYRLRGELSLRPAWAHPSRREALVEFTLSAVSLELVGAHAAAEYRRHPSPWDARPPERFHAHYADGRLLRAYLDPRDPPDVQDYKRALIGLFQFQVFDGEFNETDVSGDCRASYETVSPTVFRKIKRRCAWESGGDEWGVRARRVSRYTLSAARDSLAALHAEELVWLPATATGGGEEALGVKARSWTALTLLRDETPPPPARDLSAALAALPPHLEPAPLPMPLERHRLRLRDDDRAQSLAEAVESFGDALGGWEPGEGGTRAAAAALPPLLDALRAADADALLALLRHPDLQDRLAGLCRALGLAGTAAGWGAVRALAAPAAADAVSELALRYLEGLALSEAPHTLVVEEALRLGAEARVSSLGESALLAGAAAASRVASPALRAAARDALSASLARCKDAECRAVRLRALGNLGGEEVAELLVGSAERGERAAAADAALAALRRVPLSPARLERLGAVALNASRALPDRLLALELVAERGCAGSAVPVRVARVALALHAERGRDAHELRRALWQRLESLSTREAVRALRRVLPAELTTWDARAHGGSSCVLRRDAGWAHGGWRAALDSVQLASRGVLRRGAVALVASSRDEAALADLLSVEVSTAGLEAVAGSGMGAGADEETAASASLQLTVRGAALRPVRLFDGQAELLGHIWAGAGSAPTGVVRALVPGGGWSGAAPLQCGAALTGRAHAAAALALDAHATVSLWYRTARARLALRAGGAASASLRVRTAWSELRADATVGAEPRLSIAADLDFYDEMTLCVRAALADHRLEGRARLESAGGARALRVTRSRAWREERAGRTLSLGRANDGACRVLRAADDADEDAPPPPA